MSLKVVFNKEKLTLDFFLHGKRVESMTEKEVEEFEKQFTTEKDLWKLETSYVKGDYATLIMEDLMDEDWDDEDWEDDENKEEEKQEKLKQYRDKNIIGIELEVRWMTRLHHTEDSVILLMQDGEKRHIYYPDAIRRNFSNEQAAFGKASSRQIRRCFDEEILEYIQNHPEFLVIFNDKEVPHSCLLSDEEEIFFDFVFSSDT